MRGPTAHHTWKGKARRHLILWPLFFLICCGLGYPGLSRYDPRATPGLSDTQSYYMTVTGEPQAAAVAEVFRCRLLVPYLARPFYSFARTRLKTWNPVFFGLLIANAIFCAATACLLFEMGRLVRVEEGTALLAATLYLLNFVVPNLQLAGMVDASEAFLMLALAWTMLKGKWWLLPLWAIIGPLAKETFVPFAAVFMLAWWFGAERDRAGRFQKLAWAIASIALSVSTLLLLRLFVLGHAGWPTGAGLSGFAPRDFLFALWRSLVNHNLWYVFIWLLPLGLWRLRRLPRSWVFASACAGLTAILLGALKDIEGNVGRPLFNTVGPLLSLSTALLLTSLARKEDEGEARD